MSRRYKKADQVARQLVELQSPYDRIKAQIASAKSKVASAPAEVAEAKREKDNARLEKAQKILATAEAELEAANAKLDQTIQYYEVEYDHKQVRLTHEGETAAQEIAGVGSFYTGDNMEWSHLIQQSLRAHVVFEERITWRWTTRSSSWTSSPAGSCTGASGRTACTRRSRPRKASRSRKRRRRSPRSRCRTSSSSTSRSPA